VAPCTITFSSHYVCITKPTRAIRRLFEVGHYSNEVQRVSLSLSLARALWEKRKRTTSLPAHREAERQLCINGRRVHTDTHTLNVNVPLQRIGTFLLLRWLFSSLQKCTTKSGSVDGAERSIRMLSVFANPLTQFFPLSNSVISYECGSNKKALLLIKTIFHSF
jgi:hypothetical protein